MFDPDSKKLKLLVYDERLNHFFSERGKVKELHKATDVQKWARRGNMACTFIPCDLFLKRSY